MRGCVSRHLSPTRFSSESAQTIMLSLSRLLLAFAICALPAIGQTAAKLQQELRSKETAAKKDADKLFEVAKWAAEKALANDAKRIFQVILKVKPDHPGANEALGNDLVEGKWLPKKEAELLRKKAQAAEYAAKGFVDVGGIWVEKDKVDDAKRGVFHHEGEVVNKLEKTAFLAGLVRHPETGEIIDAKHLEKAKSGYYPVGGEGRWVDKKEADTYHSDVKRPWLVRTTWGTIMSTLGLAKIQELAAQVDLGILRVLPILGADSLHPDRRPVILIAATRTEYTDYGQAMSDGTDACGAFVVPEEGALELPYLGSVRMAICDNDKDMGTRYIRHAAALAAANAFATGAGVDLPPWLEHAFGSYTSRFQDDSDAGWFGKQHVQRGGVGNVKAFFPSFAISGDMEPKDISNNLYQAGLLLSFAVSGQDEKCNEALKAISAVLGGGKGNADKAITKLQAALIDAQPKIVTHLQQLISKSP